MPAELKSTVILTSVMQKNVPSAVVIYYCAWYVFLHDGRYRSDIGFYAICKRNLRFQVKNLTMKIGLFGMVQNTSHYLSKENWSA